MFPGFWTGNETQRESENAQVNRHLVRTLLQNSKESSNVKSIFVKKGKRWASGKKLEGSHILEFEQRNAHENGSASTWEHHNERLSSPTGKHMNHRSSFEKTKSELRRITGTEILIIIPFKTLTSSQHKEIRMSKKDENIVILAVDRKWITVLPDKRQLHWESKRFLSYTATYCLLSAHPTAKVEKVNKRLLNVSAYARADSLRPQTLRDSTSCWMYAHKTIPWDRLSPQREFQLATWPNNYKDVRNRRPVVQDNT